KYLVYQSQLKMLHRRIENIKEVNGKHLSTYEKLQMMIETHVEYAIRERAGIELMAKPSEIYSEKQLKEIFYLRDQYSRGYDELLHEGVDKGDFLVDNIKNVRYT